MVVRSTRQGVFFLTSIVPCTGDPLMMIFNRLSPGKMADQNAKAKVDLGLLEEDDEFEEFPAEEWTAKSEDSQDVNVWEDTGMMTTSKMTSASS
ncbi:hypothetical protein HPB48_023617 [Haemaphysalis longicornis]|uniref:26S proteasome complex subunit SEM1 n=1 Tax=Haemaphysalis longicornis TaxID=44386 RepID=A0A9J6H6I6_HAELO|nr:hypothetical protein HPB48_023617 [Haemaphysalis longicornis]